MLSLNQYVPVMRVIGVKPKTSKQGWSTSRRFTAIVAFALQLCRGEASAGTVMSLNYPQQTPIERITG